MTSVSRSSPRAFSLAFKRPTMESISLTTAPYGPAAVFWSNGACGCSGRCGALSASSTKNGRSRLASMKASAWA